MQVKKQENIEFITAVNELSFGEPSEETENYLKNLNRPLPPGRPPMYLYATRLEVDLHNIDALDDFSGEPKIYTATDKGEVV